MWDPRSIAEPFRMTETPSVTARLERDRLLRRAQRIEQVLAALQDRAHTTSLDGLAIERGRLRSRVSALPDGAGRQASRRPRTDRVRTFSAGM